MSSLCSTIIHGFICVILALYQNIIVDSVSFKCYISKLICLYTVTHLDASYLLSTSLLSSSLCRQLSSTMHIQSDCYYHDIISALFCPLLLFHPVFFCSLLLSPLLFSNLPFFSHFFSSLPFWSLLSCSLLFYFASLRWRILSCWVRMGSRWLFEKSWSGKTFQGMFRIHKTSRSLQGWYWCSLFWQRIFWRSSCLLDRMGESFYSFYLPFLISLLIYLFWSFEHSFLMFHFSFFSFLCRYLHHFIPGVVLFYDLNWYDNDKRR